MKICLLFLLLISFSFQGFSQKSVAQMKAAAAKAKKEIEFNNKLLNETEKTKNVSIERLNLLNQQIAIRNKYMSSLHYEIGNLEGDIAKSSVQIRTLNAQLKELQDEYKQTLFTLYKVRSSYDQLIFIMSAENYNQAYNRLKYLQYYTDYMVKQADRITLMQDSIQKQMHVYKTTVSTKQVLVVEQNQVAQKLSNDKQQESVIIQELTSKQKELKKRIDEKKAIAKKLNRQIEDAIKAEIKAAQIAAAAKARAEALAREKAAAKAAASKPNAPAAAKPVATNPNISILTPEETLISKNFADNKGRLPWPTPNGTITERFGTHPHATLSFDVECNGIEITAAKATKARAIFEGTITKIVVIPGRNTAIIIKHGNYYTVYDNLVNVNVKAGQKVSVKQELGTIFTDPDNGLTILQLQIWKDLVKLDPATWLSK